MAGLTNAESAAALDLLFPTSGASDKISWSTDGSTETSILAQTAVGATGWAAATVADPSVKANGGTLTSAAATGSGTISHFRVVKTDGTPRTDWTALDTARAVSSGGQIQAAAGDLKITLT